MAERLPTLYPMPRDLEQYWVCVQAATDLPSREDFRKRLSEELRRLDHTQTYGRAMINRLESRLLSAGFLHLTEDGKKVKIPTYAEKWDGSESGFAGYVAETVKRWGNPSVGFHSELVLMIDILGLLLKHPKREVEIVSLLTSTEPRAKYDGRDKFADRTVREFLKLLCFAHWVEKDGRNYVVTREGRRARSGLMTKDMLRKAEYLLQQSGPDTNVFDDDDKIAIAKYYMYRQCGGKGKDQYFLDRVANALYRNPYSDRPMRNQRITLDKRDRDTERRSLLEGLMKWDPDIGRQASRLRSLHRLRDLFEAAKKDDTAAAYEILKETGSRFSWQTVKKLRHGGQPFTIKEGVVPFRWQVEALSDWHSRDRRGVLAVVTGAGKTVLALLAMRDCYKENDGVKTTIIVPTKVLMYQWAVELVRLLGIPAEEIGLRGDGHKDSFSKGKKVMVVIVNSAIQEEFLSSDVASLSISNPHFLIADECHRYRGEEFRHAFDCRIDWSLGLSASPSDRIANGQQIGDSSDLVLEKCGPIIYNYSYKQALQDRIIQPFTMAYYGVDLTASEQRIYDAYTKKLAKALERIRVRYGVRLDAMSAKSFDQKLHVILQSDEEPDHAIHEYFTLVRERKDLVFASLNRKRCYLDLINDHREDKVIVFHERIEDLEEIVAPLDRRQFHKDIDGVSSETSLPSDREDRNRVDQQLEELFKKRSFKAVMYHSGHARQFWNAIAMEWFRSGVANVMLSVKALVEGVDVPKARIGIVRTSSSSVRQRIQTTGRILRRSSGKDQPAILYVIYVRDTTDERIFSGVDWSEQMGSATIESYHWLAPEDPFQKSGDLEDLNGVLPSPLIEEDEVPLEVDVTGLVLGDIYPGRYAGQELHVDANGKPFRKTRDGRRYIINPEIREAAAYILRMKRGGKFVRTPQGHLVTKIKGTGIVFLGKSGSLEYEVLNNRRVLQKLEDRPFSFEQLFSSQD